MEPSRVRAMRWCTAHVVVGVVACVVVPLASALGSESGGLSWTMFARPRRYEMRLTATRADGTTHDVPVLDVARALGPPQGAFVVGMESGMTASASSAPRRALRDFARIACALAPDARSVHARLDERDVSAREGRRTEVDEPCAR